jgi:hypothetical protein
MALGLMARRRVMEAVESHAVDVDGDSWMIRAGERFLADHPVARNPQFFAEASPDSEVTPGLGPEETESKPEPKSEPRVRAKGYLRLPGIALPSGHLGRGVTVIHEGETLPRSHPAVKARPENFEPVE